MADERLITVDDLIRGGICYWGVMESASKDWPAAFTVREALAEARRRGQLEQVRRALDLDGYGDGFGYNDGDGFGDGTAYGDGYGDDGDGYGGYGAGYSGSGLNGYGYDGYCNGYADGNGGFLIKETDQ